MSIHSMFFFCCFFCCCFFFFFFCFVFFNEEMRDTGHGQINNRRKKGNRGETEITEKEVKPALFSFESESNFNGSNIFWIIEYCSKHG